MNRVYSTGVGRVCSECGEALDACRCREFAESARPEGSSRARVSLEKKGRRGKAVTVIADLPLSALELAVAAKELKARAGTGGTVKGGTIELQGDRVELVRAWLSERGF